MGLVRRAKLSLLSRKEGFEPCSWSEVSAEARRRGAEPYS